MNKEGNVPGMRLKQVWQLESDLKKAAYQLGKEHARKYPRQERIIKMMSEIANYKQELAERKAAGY